MTDPRHRSRATPAGLRRLASWRSVGAAGTLAGAAIAVGLFFVLHHPASSTNPGGGQPTPTATAHSTARKVALAVAPPMHLAGEIGNGMVAGEALTDHPNWYLWHAPRSGTVTLAPVAHNERVSVTVYARSASGRLVELSAAATNEVRSFPAHAGNAYYLEVAPAAASISYRFVLVETNGPLVSTAHAVATPHDVTTAPSITCASAPNTWSKGPVSIACTATSNVGLENSSDASFDLVAEVAAGSTSDDASTDVRQVCDVDGNCATAGPVSGIKLSRAAPDVACDPTPVGWSADNVTITCRASDDGPGLANSEQSLMAFSTSVAPGASADVTLPAVKVCDTLGNCTTAGPFGPIKVDRTTPSASCASAPSGWVGQQVSISCTVTDAGSGLVDQAQAHLTLQTNVAADNSDASASTNSVSVCSVVGACVTVGPVRDLKVDLAPPTIVCRPPTGWASASVDVHCSASAPDGLAVPADASFTLVASVPAGTASANATTSTLRVCDAVGNCSTAGPVGEVHIDESAPQVSCGSAPTTWADAAVVIHCSAYDVYSGLANSAQQAFTLIAPVPASGESSDVATSSVKVCSKTNVCTTAGPITGIHIDTFAPRLTCAGAPSGVVTMNVEIHCGASDAGSGLRNPNDASFYLATNVAAGSDDANAPTDTVVVCSNAGKCVDAGPLTADVDRRVAPAGGPPVLEVPHQATVVLATRSVLPGIALAYPVPAAHDALGEPLATVCSPGPTARLDVGWTTITCGATDGADRQTVAAFPLDVIIDPSLGGTGAAIAGESWRAVGIDYRPGSTVVAAFDDEIVGHATAAASGVAVVEFMIPTNAGLGVHDVVLSGDDVRGNPLTVVVPVASKELPAVTGPSASSAPGGARTTAMNPDAPRIPSALATLPRSSGPIPTVPPATHLVLHPLPTTSSVRSTWWWLAPLLGLIVVLGGASGAVVVRRRRRAFATERDA